MLINTELSQKIYNNLTDDISRRVFSSRLGYVSTLNSNFLLDLCDTYAPNLFKNISDCLNKGFDFVIVGAGFTGLRLGYILIRGNARTWFADNDAENIGNIVLWEKNYGRCLTVEESTRLGKNTVYIICSNNPACDRKQLIDLSVPMKNIFVMHSNPQHAIQYFDIEQCMVAQGDTFVDAGGYNGETTKKFYQYAGKESRAYVFEPEYNQYLNCQDKLKCFSNAQVFNKGLWDKADVLRFKMRNGYDGRISESGDHEIDVVALDEELEGEKITFIKMDTEGAEFNALLGAKRIIQNQKPKLAISVYHKNEDIYLLPELVLKLNPNYKLFFRHYSPVHCDTVMYAVDK